MAQEMIGRCKEAKVRRIADLRLNIESRVSRFRGCCRTATQTLLALFETVCVARAQPGGLVSMVLDFKVAVV